MAFWEREEEAIPLTREVRGQSLRTRRMLSATGRRYLKYCMVGALAIVLVNLLLTLHTSLSLTRQQIDRIVYEITPSLEPADEELVLPPGDQLESGFPGAADQIVSLAGKPNEYTSRLFSGYLHLHNGGDAFYFFAESQSASEANHDPVLLWLNGGPGASSLSGCFSENGPLLVNEDGQSLKVNPSAWNQRANLLCIESPVGVGFSFNTAGAYESDDLSQARDLYDALQRFFDKFPWLRANDFIISGESYGGVYVSTTARAIVEGNLKGDEPKINLKTFMVGNGVNEFSGQSIFPYAYYHGLLSTQQYMAVRESCPTLQELHGNPVLENLDLSSVCGRELLRAYTTMFHGYMATHFTTGKCAGVTQDRVRLAIEELMTMHANDGRPISNPLELCVDDAHLNAYFNLAEVRSALHVDPKVGQWSAYTLTAPAKRLHAALFDNTFDPAAVDAVAGDSRLNYKASVNAEVTPIWKFLLQNHVRAVIYNGDAALVCDVVGAQWAVESLRLSSKTVARSTWTLDSHVGGYVEVFDGLHFVTVREAGLLSPMTLAAKAKKRLLDLFVLDWA